MPADHLQHRIAVLDPRRLPSGRGRGLRKEGLPHDRLVDQEQGVGGGAPARVPVGRLAQVDAHPPPRHRPAVTEALRIGGPEGPRDGAPHGFAHRQPVFEGLHQRRGLQPRIDGLRLRTSEGPQHGLGEPPDGAGGFQPGPQVFGAGQDRAGQGQEGRVCGGLFGGGLRQHAKRERVAVRPFDERRDEGRIDAQVLQDLLRARGGDRADRPAARQARPAGLEGPRRAEGLDAGQDHAHRRRQGRQEHRSEPAVEQAQGVVVIDQQHAAFDGRAQGVLNPPRRRLDRPAVDEPPGGSPRLQPGGRGGKQGALADAGQAMELQQHGAVGGGGEVQQGLEFGLAAEQPHRPAQQVADAGGWG